jgi:hypothetical protein
MNHKKHLLPLLALLSLGLAAFAADPAQPQSGHDHDHDHAYAEKIAAPNGGRLLAGLKPRAEFLVLPDRRAQITFVNDHGQPVAPAAQTVTVTAGDRSAPTRLTFTRSGNVLVSDVPLPAGNDFPTVVQIKPAPDAKTVVARFNLNLATCPECKKAEYACSCDHT